MILTEVVKGSIFRHIKTGKTVIILTAPNTNYDAVHLRHESGRESWKQYHYFRYEYEKC